MFGQTTTLYNIPIEHLDYKYITQCDKLKELEKILKVLRSGTEGRFPELEEHCEEKIRSLDPENRLLRKPGKLLSTTHLPQEEREEVEDEFQRWLEETKRNETVVKMSLPVIDNAAAIPGVPAVRSEGCISAATGKGTKRVTSTTKSSKPRTYEEWAKIEKELEKELEDQENKNDKDFEGAAAANPSGSGDSTSVKPSCAGLAAKAEAMPLAVRRMHAQLEKEKGNEAEPRLDDVDAKIHPASADQSTARAGARTDTLTWFSPPVETVARGVAAEQSPATWSHR
nr:unnamed protein product [Spirometra erinaceieuropaei]